jgi:hypothetical protein
MPMPDLHPFQLAHFAGCLAPDSLTSCGANFLRRIYDGVTEFIDDLPAVTDDDDFDGSEQAADRIHELTDSAIPVGTHDLWKVFVELGGYDPDVCDVNDIGFKFKADEAYKLPQAALYLIGTGLGNTLVVKYRPVLCPTCEGQGVIEGIGERTMQCHTCQGQTKISRHLLGQQEN